MKKHSLNLQPQRGIGNEINSQETLCQQKKVSFSLPFFGPQSFLYGAQSAMPRPWANISMYRPRARLIRCLIMI